MAVVRDIGAVDACTGAMEALGHEGLGENGLPGRRYVRKGGDHRTHDHPVDAGRCWGSGTGGRSSRTSAL